MNKNGVEFLNKSRKQFLYYFCPERFSTIPVNHLHNGFEFRFEPWLVEYFFKDFSLQIKEDGLFGGHPLINKMDCNYTRQS